jgi:hypothetical protein
MAEIKVYQFRETKVILLDDIVSKLEGGLSSLGNNLLKIQGRLKSINSIILPFCNILSCFLFGTDPSLIQYVMNLYIAKKMLDKKSGRN